MFLKVLKNSVNNETRSTPILTMVYSVGAVKTYGSNRRLQTVLATDGMVKFEVYIFIYIYIYIFHFHHHINLDQNVE